MVVKNVYLLTENICKHYITNLSNMLPRRVINYRVARVPTETGNVLGLLVTELHILDSTMNLHVKRVECVILACGHLHNVLCSNKDAQSLYLPPGI
jgi:hypothetical protein